MDYYGKTSIRNQLCIDLVSTTSPSTSSSASSITSSPTSPISQESPSLCNVRFHREHSEPSIIINNNNNNTPTSQNANLTNNTQEMIIQPTNNGSNKKSFMTSTIQTQRHYSSSNNHINKKSKKPTIDTKRTTSTLLSSYQQSQPPVRYNNVYRFYNGGGSNNNKSADFVSYNNPDRIIPTDELALFMRNKRRYCPPNFRPIPPSAGGWNDVVPDRTIPWELTCENHTDVAPFLRIRALDGPLELPWKPIATTITSPATNTTGSWTLSSQARHRQQQQQLLRRDDSRSLHHRSLENGTSSTSSFDASTTNLHSPSSSSSLPSHYSLPLSSPSLSPSSLSSSQHQIYSSVSRSNHHGDLVNNIKDEPSIQPTRNKKKILSPLDTSLTQRLNPPTMAYASSQPTVSEDSTQELHMQAAHVDTTPQIPGWNLQQQQQQPKEQQKQDHHHYSHSFSTPPSDMRQQQQRTSFEPLSPPPSSIDTIDHSSRSKIGPIGPSCSLFLPWGSTSPPQNPSTWLHDISPMEDSNLQQQQQQQRRSSSFAKEYDPNTTGTSSYFRTRSSSLGIVRPQRRSLHQQKDDIVPCPSTLWKYQPLLSPASAALPTESSSSSSTSSSSSSFVWPLMHQQQQQQHFQYQHQRPPTPDEIQDQRGKRSSTSDIQAWQHHHQQQQQQLHHQLQQWTLTSTHCDSRPTVPQQRQQQQREIDNRSISILRVLDTDNDRSTGHYSLFSKPVVDIRKKQPSPPIDINNNNNNNSNNTTAGKTTNNNHPNPHHRLYYNISDYVVVSDA